MRSFDEAFAPEARDGGSFVSLDGFGGLTLGCATLAAARKLPDMSLHSVHTCFLRPVPTEHPVELRVESLSHGRRFARRRVEIREGDRLYFELLASFAGPLAGPDFDDDPDIERPEPEDLPSELEVAEAEGWDSDGGPHRLIEMRWCGRPWDLSGPAASSRYETWVRPLVPPESAAGRDAGIVFLSDYHSHWPATRKLGGSFDTEGFVSLDQVVWIHRDDAWDDWWLFSSWTDQGHAGRSLGHRTLRTRDGRLVASMAQEAMIPGARLLANGGTRNP